MIELAPASKAGLALSGPVMIAAGCAGYGDAYEKFFDLSALGAVVTNPITLRPRHGPAQSRLAETLAGFVLNTGGQNPGVRQVLRQYRTMWRRLGLPVIAHLPAAEPDDLERTARAVCSLDSLAAGSAIAGIELGVPAGAFPQDVRLWIEAIRQGCILPVLVRLPVGEAASLAEAAASQADALVIGAPPLGAAVDPATGQTITGSLYGPAVHPLALAQLQQVRSLVDLPLVGAGGIHSEADARAFLAAGAVAVQLDSLLFIEPQAAYRIALALATGGN